MGALADTRLALKEILEGGVISDGSALAVLDVPPSTLMPPALLLEPSDPWWSMNDRLPTEVATVRWDVVVLAGKGTQEAMTPRVEALAEQVIDAVLASEDGWTVEVVSAPLLLTLATDSYLGLRVTVAIPARIVA